MDAAEGESNVLPLLLDTLQFAAVKHKDQRRKDIEGTPYINHPIGVAAILCLEGNVQDLSTLQAALLHDTVEDTDTTFEEIEQRYGRHVRLIVEQLTDDKRLSKLERKHMQVVSAAQRSHPAKLIMLADKLYNVRDIQRQTPVHWTEYDAKAYVTWALDVVNQIRGTHPLLEAKLDDVFVEYGVMNRPIVE